MLIKKSFLGFLAAIALGACSNEEGKNDDSIILNDGIQLSQTIYADETQKNGSIKFTATEPWTITVDEVKTKAEGSNVDWLKLSAYSGGVGEFALNLTLTPNTSGKSRKAEIRIMAGKTVLTITVEQKAETESGEEVPQTKVAKKITYRLVDNTMKVMLPDVSDYVREQQRAFSYDENGRVARIVKNNSENGRQSNSIMLFDYTIAGEIAIKEQWSFDDGDTYTDNYIAKLNEQGNAISLQTNDKGTGVFKDYIRFSYTADHRLAQWKDADAGSETSLSNFSYSNGLLSKFEYISGKYSDESRVINIDTDKAYSSRRPNNASVDMCGVLLQDDDDYDFLFYIGRLGKTSDYLPEVMPDIFVEDEWHREISDYTEPDKTYTEEYYSIKWSGKDLVLVYTYDADKCLTGIQTERSFSVMKNTWTVKTTNELVDPNHPEHGYKFTKSETKTTKVNDDKNVYTWTIEY